MLAIQTIPPLTWKLESLMEHLQPLKDIRFTWGRSSSLSPWFPLSLLGKVLQRHGRTLRRLTLDCAIDSQLIHLLESLCSQLEYLDATVPYLAIYIEPPQTHVLSKICPNISSLQELVLSTGHSGLGWIAKSNLSIRSIWALICGEKRELPLHRLCIRDTKVSLR